MDFYSILRYTLCHFPPRVWVPLGWMVKGGSKIPTFSPALYGGILPRVRY